jgi:hypothetical protein
MLRSIDELDKGFRTTAKKSKKECGKLLEELRKATFFCGLFKLYYTCLKKYKEKYGAWGMALHHACLLDLFKISGHILFLSYNGLYRNAFDNIRYALESIVQALYIDIRHSKTPLAVKIEIWKEVEDKREYHASHIISELKPLEHKDVLLKEYKELSGIIHPSHKQVITLMHEIKSTEKMATSVDCEEIAKIRNSMLRMYDIFFFLVTNYFPELKESLKKDTDFIKGIESYKLYLLSKALDIKL